MGNTLLKRRFEASFVILLSLVLLLLITDSNQMVMEGGGSGSPSPSSRPSPVGLDCRVACGGRCAKTKRPNLCKRACGSCCARCNCVPPGTSGNYEACPCYFNLKTHNNTRKCP